MPVAGQQPQSRAVDTRAIDARARAIDAWALDARARAIDTRAIDARARHDRGDQRDR